MSKTIVSSDGTAKRKSGVKSRITPQPEAAAEATQDVAALAASCGYGDMLQPSPATNFKESFVDGRPLPDTAITIGPASIPVELQPLKQVKKIAIVGKAPSTIPLAPWNNPEWEIWGLSDLILHPSCTRWTRWFELHDPEGWHPDDSVPRRQKWHPKYWEHLCGNYTDGRTVYVAEPHPEMPHAKLFPWKHLVEKYSLRDEKGVLRPYFTNTVSWLLAYAIDQGATHISLWGVDMAQQEKGVKSEYAYQRPSVEFFLGWAAGHGCEVIVPEASDLMKAVRLYGIDRLAPALRSLHRKRSKDLRKLKQEAEHNVALKRQELRQVEDRLHVILGAVDDCDQWFGQHLSQG